MPVFWAVGLFAGTDIDTLIEAARFRDGDHRPAANALQHLAPTAVGRFELRYRDVEAREGDARGGPVRAMVGASGQARAELDGSGRAVANVDGVVKWQGLAASAAVFFSAARDPDGLPFAEGVGGYTRISYSLSDLLECAAGVSSVVPLTAPTEAVHDIKLGATGFLLKGGELKLGFDVGPRINGFALHKPELVGRAHLLLLY